ncbi:MAG: 16S rRNA (cytosine(967)-C(5))-methyltransferase RsmB [Ruminococcaceae bacterium]|nr:16S rRNA (cytosine(967)-C(5))-methyltransferase RsmB [Oscillospiraceae bacterium]
MAEQITARRLAFHSLLKCHRDKKYSNIELDSVISKNKLDPRERALLTALVYGVIEKRITLDFIISRLSSRPLDDIVPAVMTALEMGIYQILYFDRVPDSAACNESVEIAKKTAGNGAANFVNALLRETVRRKDSIFSLFDGLEENERMSVEYSVPVWMVKLFTNCYGREKAVEILQAFGGKSYMTLHANTLKITPQQLTQRLEADGIKAVCREDVKSAVELMQNVPITALSGYEGLYFIQDAASQLAVQKLGAKPGDTIIDCCACPGGKSIACALDMNNSGKILSMDLHKNKLSLIEKSAGLMGVDIITTLEHDGTQPLDEYIGKADKVVCDVPCSGLGVVHKKPDIRHKSPEDIARLPQTQKKILAASAQYLKVGGRLLYSTCTLNKAENEDITDEFLSESPSFKRIFSTTLFPVLKDEMVQNDGFYIDVLERVM